MFILVDRDTRRFKLDKEFKDDFSTFREKLDIADFDINSFLTHQIQSQSISEEFQAISIAKHLCGGATDLSMTSMAQLAKGKFKGVSIATCCHHVCDEITYVNLEFLTKYFTMD